jgi:toxin ParE1/3/4
MATFRLTRKAREDLKSIARYTQKTWGVAQRNKYLTQLDKRFAVLADAPTLGRSCDAIRPGYRKYHEGRHLIFYVPIPEAIKIVRILHDSMDAERHL